MRTLEFVPKGKERIRKRRTILAIAVVLGCILLQLLGPATAMESDHYAINWSVMGGGGEPIGSANYALNATIGQLSIGFKSSTNYELCSGFWCGGKYSVYLPLVLRNS